VSRMRYRTLGRTGLAVSVIGFGASPLGNEFGETDPSAGERAVHAAIDSGINFFDVAPYYGRTLAEERLGTALEGKRDQVILATKCGRYDVDQFDFSAGRVSRSIEESLRRLKTDYVDLLQVHDVEFGDANQIIHETLPALEEIRRQGKARFIGITGFPLGVLVRIASQFPVSTILSYCRSNLLINDLDTRLRPFAAEHGIGLINASPLHMGIWTEQGPPPWHPAPPDVLAAAKTAVNLLQSSHVPPSRFALRYCLDFSPVATTVVGMSTEDQVKQNLAALEYPNDPEMLGHVRQLVAPVRNRTWPSGRPENRDNGVC
jgi:L-galactose dehydrogenase